VAELRNSEFRSIITEKQPTRPKSTSRKILLNSSALICGAALASEQQALEFGEVLCRCAFILGAASRLDFYPGTVLYWHD
jgi:hypothetical protein